MSSLESPFCADSQRTTCSAGIGSFAGRQSSTGFFDCTEFFQPSSFVPQAGTATSESVGQSDFRQGAFRGVSVKLDEALQSSGAGSVKASALLHGPEPQVDRLAFQRLTPASVKLGPVFSNGGPHRWGAAEAHPGSATEVAVSAGQLTTLAASPAASIGWLGSPASH